jgi:hypothetical protein
MATPEDKIHPNVDLKLIRFGPRWHIQGNIGGLVFYSQSSTTSEDEAKGWLADVERAL